MISSRRGFLASLLAAPLVGRFLPKVLPNKLLARCGPPFLTANVWDVVPPMTEAQTRAAFGLPPVDNKMYLSWYDERTGLEVPMSEARASEWQYTGPSPLDDPEGERQK